MDVANFSNTQELEAFITTQGILQAQVVRIVERGGRWYLFWWV